MPNNPPSFRYPIHLPADIHPDVRETLQNHDDAITDLQQAIPELKSQITTATASTTNTTTNTNSGSETVVVGADNTVGTINNQIGETSYTTQPSDYGAFLLFGDASAVAVTLSTGVTFTQPWFFVAINYGSSTTTLTPASGTISYGTTSAASSMPLLAGYMALISFDGMNFWSASQPIVPVTFNAVANEFLTAYNATSGAFSAAQPTIANVSGLSAALALLAPLASPTLSGTPTTPTASPGTNTTQIASTAFVEAALAPLAPIASPTFTGTITEPAPPVLTAATTATSATAGAASALPATPLGYLEWSVNGVIVKLAYYSI